MVFSANEPCPRSGNPTCHCTGENGATIPTENIWADDKADEKPRAGASAWQRMCSLWCRTGS